MDIKDIPVVRNYFFPCFIAQEKGTFSKLNVYKLYSVRFFSTTWLRQLQHPKNAY